MLRRCIDLPLLCVVVSLGCEPIPEDDQSDGIEVRAEEIEPETNLETDRRSDDGEFDEGCGADARPQLTIEWGDDRAELPLKSSAGIRVTSEFDFPVEVVVRERWDGGGQEQNVDSLGSFALDSGESLDLRVGATALANAGREYSGMLKVSVDIYDPREARRIATVHSAPRFFHDAGSKISFYTEEILVAEHGAGLLIGEIPAAALRDEDGHKPLTVTRVVYGGAGVVGERVEIGNPNSAKDAP